MSSTEKIISTKVTLKFKYLNNNIEQHIYDNIKETVIGKCFKQHGYINDIKEIVSYKENVISNTNSAVIFNVTFIAIVLNPQIGDIYYTNIFYLDCNSILVTLENKLKMIVPPFTLVGFKYDDVNNYYVNGDDKYMLNDKMKIEIVNVRFLNNKFDYIAKFVSL